MTEDFEQSVVRGKAHWITSFVYELAASRLVIQLTDNVESPGPTLVVEFIDILHLEIHWTDRDDNRIEGLLGAQEEVAGNVRYLLVTDQREVELTTRKKAVINSGPYLQSDPEPS